MSRKEIISFIKKHDLFYYGTSFKGHSIGELEKIKAEIESAGRKKAEKKFFYMREWLNYADVVIKTLVNMKN